MRIVVAEGCDKHALQPLLYDPDFFLDTQCDLYFKSEVGGTTTVGITTLNGQRYAIKRYNSKGVWKAILSQFRISRAQRTWRFIFELKRLGVPVVEPVALLEKRFGPIKLGAYFISQYVPGVEAARYFSENSSTQEHWPAVLKKIANISQLLRKAKIRYRDFQPHNVLVMNHEPYLLDFDYMFNSNKSDASFDKVHQNQINGFLRKLNHSPKAKALFEAELQAIGETV